MMIDGGDGRSPGTQGSADGAAHLQAAPCFMARRRLRGLLLSCAGALLGCAHSTMPPGYLGSSPPDDDATARSRADYYEQHHYAGADTFISMSLDALAVDPARKPVIDNIRAELNTRMAPPRAAEDVLLAALADGVAAGNIDTARVGVAVAALQSAVLAVSDEADVVWNELHELLTAGERSALVDQVHMHWQVWRRVNLEAEPGGRETGSRLARLSQELTLTPEQAQQIATSYGKAMAGLTGQFNPGQTEARLKEFSAAFVASPFDAHDLRMGRSANGDLAAHGTRRMVLFYETVTPVLTPVQCAKLAGILRGQLNHPAAIAGG